MHFLKTIGLGSRASRKDARKVHTTAPAHKLHVIGKAQIENQLIISSSGQATEGAQINLFKGL